MNKTTIDKQSYFIDKTDVNSIDISLEGGRFFIEGSHLTKGFSAINKRIRELEKSGGIM